MRQVIEHQIAQRETELTSLNEQAKSLRERINITGQMLSMRKKLVDKGLISRIIYLNTKQEYNTAEREYGKNRGVAKRTKGAIAEARGKRAQLDAELRNEAAVNLGQAASELTQLRLAVDKLRDRFQRLEVRAPVRGIVKGLSVNTIGGVVASGGVIAEIVPLDRELVVEARLSPSDIGHLKVGQPVSVKVQTFDFARYGTITGQIDRISASTFQDEEGATYYKANVVLDRNYVGNNPAKNPILPGMVVDADISTGHRTLLRYLLRPVYESLDRAFAER